MQMDVYRLGVSVEAPKRLIGRMSSCAVPFGTRSFPLSYPALTCRALEIVPSLRDSLRCFDRLVWSWAALTLFNLNGEIELSKKLIWTSMAELSPERQSWVKRNAGPVPPGTAETSCSVSRRPFGTHGTPGQARAERLRLHCLCYGLTCGRRLRVHRSSTLNTSAMRVVRIGRVHFIDCFCNL